MTVHTNPNRQLRHEIRFLLADTDLSDEVGQLLAGEPGLSFATQRERVQGVRALFATHEESELIQQADALAVQLLATIDAREAEANDPVAKTTAAVTAAKATLEALTAARVAAQEQEFALKALLDQLAEVEAEMFVPETTVQAAD